MQTTMAIKINGMSCQHCVGAVRRALQAVPGVEVTDVQIGSAAVQFDPAETAPERITDAVTEEGYEVVAAT